MQVAEQCMYPSELRQTLRNAPVLYSLVKSSVTLEHSEDQLMLPDLV